ncbi:MAG: 16S rRNA (uracil(1498)-N(3))-methyltransferase [Spirochaetaceae bacterium]|nr:16S rRNA (uracil(1498)-N(3))-methyltransferase [Spirochaetaceae bacterium]
MNIILLENGETTLSPRDPRAVHLVKVLRKTAGESFCAGIIGGRRGRGVITAINAGGITLELNLDETPPPRLPIEILLGFPRPIQLRRILATLSSAGVAAISLFASELGEKSYRSTTLLHDGGAQAALLDGAIQARDTSIPALSFYTSLSAALAVPRPGGLFTAAADNVAAQGIFAIPRAGGYVIAIGSERGWSDNERALLGSNGFPLLSLGSRALRTETAAATAAVITALAYERGGLQG